MALTSLQSRRSKPNASRADRPLLRAPGEGSLCLNFVNTVPQIESPDVGDEIATFPALVDWLYRSAELTAKRRDELLGALNTEPGVPATILRQAHALRRALHGLLGSRTNADADLSVVNALLSRASANAQLNSSLKGCCVSWQRDDTDPLGILWPVVRSAAELLAGDDFSRLNVCGDRDCSWVFVDTTKNHSKRYCSSATCGNRTRVRRHYESKRATRRQASREDVD
jgi:predicted RNA-binding Zn ribbon-like protein